MSRLAVALILMLLSCKDPYLFEPGDPNKPDPPVPPRPIYPLDGENTKNYGYPQDVAFSWERVAGATFYQIEIYRDTTGVTLLATEDRITATSHPVSLASHGFYSWRVRAGGPNWNWYTDWSDLNWFILPNPAR